MIIELHSTGFISNVCYSHVYLLAYSEPRVVDNLLLSWSLTQKQGQTVHITAIEKDAKIKTGRGRNIRGGLRNKKSPLTLEDAIIHKHTQFLHIVFVL